MIPDNQHIQGAFFKAIGYLDESKNIAVSVSGGSDSDIIVDFVNQCGVKDNVHYIFFDTGLEYEATKDHLDYLEKRYGIQIDRIKAYRSIPYCCKTYGLPFISKFISMYIERLQKHGFKFEDKSLEELRKEYSNCDSALRWWCNRNEGGIWNISYKKFLKEFPIENPPDFKISANCCKYAKKKTAYKYYKAAVGDGLKIIPSPASPGNGGTVQPNSTPALNTKIGCGSGTIDCQTLRVRYLTPRECLRLQAFPDDAIDKLIAVLPKSALYKVAGNSIAVCCLKAIFKGIYIDRTFSKMYRQTNMFQWGA